MKRLIMVLVIFGLILVGCSDSTSSNNQTDDGKTTISFWHNLDGDNAVTLEGIIDNFNEQSDTIEVSPSFQDNVQQQMRTVGSTDSAPVVFMGGDNAYYSQSGYITPIEEMIDQDSEFDVSNMNEAVIANHSLNDTLSGMPFNVFVPLLFYNTDLFTEAGLDPNNPPQTFSEIQEAAETLTSGSGSAPDIYGFSIPIYIFYI